MESHESNKPHETGMTAHQKPNSEQNCSVSEAFLAVERLTGFYPGGEVSDPETFSAGLAKLFTSYPRGAVDKALDPVLGLPGTSTWLPRIAEVKAFLDKQLAERAARDRYNAELFAQRDIPEPGVLPPDQRPDVPELIAKVAQRAGIDPADDTRRWGIEQREEVKTGEPGIGGLVRGWKPPSLEQLREKYPDGALTGLKLSDDAIDAITKRRLESKTGA